MPRAESDRNLLFGVLALQMDFISRDALIAAMNAWVLDKSRPLSRILVERGDLHPDDFALLDPLVAKHVERHDNDPERSLESLSSASWLRQGLGGIADPELNAGVARLGADKAGDPDPSATVARSIGDPTSSAQRFRILRPHASGGLGEVYVARDAELNREVALKQIKDGYADHPESRSRFLLEAEVTGGLEHPGIVPVYGLGHYPDGRPFYAMRFIRGDSLKQAIDRFHRDDRQPGRDPGERTMALRQLLRRYVDVCNAVAYAHSRGVLHRDLKPGNVMLGPYGETLVVDWGLAKPMGRSEGADEKAEATLRPSSGSGRTPTQMGSAIGTPAYMSPEQAAGRLDELGPASDVYSLGAMLYSLLTGQAPFRDPEVGDVLRKVQAGDFPSPRRIGRAVPPALEAVCLKAMAREPGRRYSSPRVLADEIEHWLADEPVAAWREPFWVPARRWMRRHRTAVTGAAAAVLAGLVGLGAVAGVQHRSNRELRRAYDRVSDALASETRARNEKEAALVRSEEERKRAEAVLGFLRDDVLAAARPEHQEGGLGKDVTVRQSIDAAEPKIAAAFKDQPLIEAEIRDTLGLTYSYLGESRLAEPQLERAYELRQAKLGPDHPATLASRTNLAASYNHASRIPEAIRMNEETLARRIATLGPDHPDTLGSRNNLAEDYRAAGRTRDVVRMHEETLALLSSKLGPDHPDTLTSRNNLANAYIDVGRARDAARMHEETLALCVSKLGPAHPDTLTSRNSLANAYFAVGRARDAVRMHEETLALLVSKLGHSHPFTLRSQNNLAQVYLAIDRTKEGIRMLEATLATQESKFGRDDPDTLTSRNNLAIAYADSGLIPEAIRMDEETLALRASRLGADHPATLTSRNNLALAYSLGGRVPEAIRMHEATLARRMATLGPDHPDSLTSRNNLAVAYYRAGQTDHAIPHFEAVLRLRESNLGPDHPNTLTSRNNLAMAYESSHRWAKAEAARRATLAHRRKVEKPESPALAHDLARLGTSLMEQSKWSDAEPLLRECLSIREKALPDDWLRFDAMSQLGGALLGQRRFSEAEPLIIGGYEGMKARESGIPPGGKSRLSAAAGRVIRLYESWGRPDKAAEWKVKLGLADLPPDVFAPP